MTGLDELKVPKALRPVVDEIVAITDSVCLAVFDEEYADLARRAVAKLAGKRPSPLLRGRRATWAAGVVYALGQANFLSDPATGPTVTADRLSEAFGVAKTTMGSKARQVRDLLRIGPFSPEFERADVAAQNPLKWIIQVDGLAVDARHVPLNIQVAAFERGFIPYVPALGPDGREALPESWMTGMASSAPPPEAGGLLERCSELKRQLVELACSPRFSGRLDQALNEHAIGPVASEADVTNVVDDFILQRPLPDGRTVTEVFAAEHPDLTDDDRRVLESWREVVAGVFEIREQAGDSITATRLGDERTYRIRANAGPAALAPMRPGCFMTARIVPVGDDWMLSGPSSCTPPQSAPRCSGWPPNWPPGTHPLVLRRNEDDQPPGRGLAFERPEQPGDLGGITPELAMLVGELSVQDADFRSWWASHQVTGAGYGTKHCRHPLAGDLTLDCDT
jgi:hypothetical protein